MRGGIDAFFNRPAHRCPRARPPPRDTFRIPPVLPEVPTASLIKNARPGNQIDLVRHWTWKALSRTPQGRELLRKTMTEAENDWSTHAEMREIAEILKLRAEATLELKRFDFMSETECQETLKVCASVKP